ncbi:hypothetical protein B0T26DRAFT_868789 [Lasiosphaeria miniovina]|uniref:Cyanovirin-N domain-containing protein n=1 Tax=Lasiosphaeria miniovina TaxID=1954250 RepID=A0AA40E746_9PEZI|nr:uncharacterized protein B0T26DRAFT_868789 [Lasiosphaeria miniovina]KAK0727507.1 hypothetical protein B0T26DRAFT_868789 [Lasiosphaeria miniovina]
MSPRPTPTPPSPFPPPWPYGVPPFGNTPNPKFPKKKPFENPAITWSSGIVSSTVSMFPHASAHGPYADVVALHKVDLAGLTPPPSVIETCNFIQVDLDLNDENSPGKNAYIQAACRNSNAGSQTYRCSKLGLRNCFSNNDGTLIPVADNAGKWWETCTDYEFDAIHRNIKCACWQSDGKPNITAVDITSGIWNVGGVLYCGGKAKAKELGLNNCAE